jgi:multiple sugar transport system ATP-binding protein
MSVISLKGVGKQYPGGQVAVRDLTLEIADGELLAILGPSGSGKSTVLRLIAGLEAVTSGTITIDDRDVTGVLPQDRDVAMVFQNYALYPHKTVRENLAFPLQVRRVDAARIEGLVRDTAAALGIDALLDRKPAQLSGGQRQRVALGRAIVREPRAFLLDEPLSNLDPLLRVATRAELALLHRRLRATMVHVTHDQEEAMTLGTRVAVMRDGVIEQIATPREVYGRPANRFVAGFVGTPAMNIWRAASGVLIGVRPHDIDLTEDGSADGAGRAEIVEPLGPATLVHLRVDDRPDDLLRVMAPADLEIAVGDRAGIRLRRDRLHLFDASTGVRVEPDPATAPIP